MASCLEARVHSDCVGFVLVCSSVGLAFGVHLKKMRIEDTVPVVRQHAVGRNAVQQYMLTHRKVALLPRAIPRALGQRLGQTRCDQHPALHRADASVMLRNDLVDVVEGNRCLPHHILPEGLRSPVHMRRQRSTRLVPLHRPLGTAADGLAVRGVDDALEARQQTTLPPTYEVPCARALPRYR